MNRKTVEKMGKMRNEALIAVVSVCALSLGGYALRVIAARDPVPPVQIVSPCMQERMEEGRTLPPQPQLWDSVQTV